MQTFIPPSPDDVVEDAAPGFRFAAPIDTNRPKLGNSDGSFSTEKTITVGADDKFFVIPTIVDGKRNDDETAIKLWRAGKNNPVGIFDSQKEADDYAVGRSSEIGKVRGFSFTPPKPNELLAAPENLAQAPEMQMAPYGGRGVTSEPRVGEPMRSEPTTGGDLWRGVNTPIRKILNVPDDVAKYIGPALAPHLASKIFPKDSFLAKGNAALAKGTQGLVDSFLSPLGLATLGIGSAPLAVQRAVAGAFAAYAAFNLKPQVEQIYDQFKSGDWEGGTSASVELLGNSVLAGLAAKHALTGAPKPSTAIGEPKQPVAPKGAQADKIASEILKARRDGPTAEFKSLFGGIDPEVAGTTAESVSAYAKSLGMEYKPVASEPIPEKPTTPTKNAVNPIVEPIRVEGQLPRTEAQQNLPANAPEVRQSAGTVPDAGNRPIPTTPLETAQPSAVKTEVIPESLPIKPTEPVAQTVQPLSLKSGDVAPVEFDSMFGPQPYFRLTAPIIAPDSGNVMAVGEKITKAVLDKYRLKVPDSEMGKVPQPEGKYSVYEKNGRWLMQVGDKRGFGDEILGSQDHALARSEQVKKLDASNAEFRARQDAALKEQQRIQAEKEGPLKTYLDTLSDDPMDVGRYRQILSKETVKRSGAKIYSGDRAKIVRDMLAEGYAPKTEQVSAVPDVSSTRYNRMDAREQAEFEKRQKEAGKKIEYRLENPEGSLFTVTKAEHDYAKWLAGKRTAPSPIPPVDQPVSNARERDPSIPLAPEERQARVQKITEFRTAERELEKTLSDIESKPAPKSVKSQVKRLDAIAAAREALRLHREGESELQPPGPEISIPQSQLPQPAAGEAQLNSPQFKAWFGNSQAADSSGNPKVFFHGTIADFYQFDNSKLNQRALYGPGHYFTDNPNLAGGDETTKGYSQKGHLSEDELLDEHMVYEGETWEQAEKRVRSELKKHNEDSESAMLYRRTNKETGSRYIESYNDVTGYPNVIPVYLKSENPLDITDVVDDWEKILQNVQKLRPSINFDEGFDRLSSGLDNVTGEQLYQSIRHGIDENGHTIGKAETNKILQELGYDSIIHVGGGIKGDTAHNVTIVFKPEQIKSAIGNRGTFDTTNPDIRASLGKSEPSAVREGFGSGVESSRDLVTESGLSARTIQVAQELLDLPMMQDPFWDNLRVELTQVIDGGAKGTRLRNLIQLAATATPDTLPHEIAHILFDALTPQNKIDLDKARREALAEHFPDAPPEVVAGSMGSDAYRQSSLPLEMYRYSTASEFMSHFFGEQFAKESFAARNNGFWRNFADQVKRMAMALWDAIMRLTGRSITKERAYREFRNGTWTPRPESGAKAEARQASLARTPKEYEKQRTFNEPGTPERTMGAYGDVVSLKEKAANDIQAGEKARKLVSLTNQELLASFASIDMATPRLVFGNYDAMRARTEGSDMGLKTGVIVDAFRGLGYEQYRMIKLRRLLAKQEGVVNSASFRKKMAQMWDRQVGGDTAKEIREAFGNQIAQQAGDVIRELNEKGKTDAQYDELRNALARLKKMESFNSAVTQRVSDIVDVVSSTPEGFRMIEQGGDRTGTQIARAYMDIKQSIADAGKTPKPGEKLSNYDRQYLSDAERQRLESNLPMFDDNAKAFINLASQVLAANAELRLKLATLAHYRIDPQFKAQVTAVGDKFRKQYEADPNNAIRQIVKTASSLKAKEINAENAFLRLNKQIIPEIEKLNDLQEAVKIDNLVTESPEWRSLVNRIYEDNSKLAPAFRIPDSEIPLLTANTVWNEFTGRQQLRSPQGTVFDLDVGYTKASVTHAQDQMFQFLDETSAWLGDSANADSPDRAYWNMRYDFIDAALNVSTVLSPTVSYARLGVRGPWGMMEFMGKGMALPAAKLAFSAANNFQRAWAVADQWFQGVAPEMRNLLGLAAKSHGFNPDMEIFQYRNDVLNLIASDYRHGIAIKAGDKLINGLTVTPQDIAAFKYQGRIVNELFGLQRNISREKIMVDGLLVDEWAKNVFGVRAPQELGAAPGTTLPHEFSERGKNLALEVAKINPGNVPELSALLDGPRVFNDFVKRFFSERRSDYSNATPFEDLYKQLAVKWRNFDPDAPRSISDIVDYIESNVGPQYDRGAIQSIVLGEMEGQLRKFHRDFVAKEEPSDVRADRATKNTAFTTGFNREVGSSFFYDFGMVTTPEVRSMGIDSTNFHLVRLVKSLDGAVQDYDRALAEFPGKDSTDKERKAFIKARFPRFKAGDDFRDFERLQDDRNNIAYLRDNIGKAYGRQQVQSIELFSRFGRFSGDAINAAMTGLSTGAKILVGSVVKMGLTMGGVKRWYMGAYLEGMVSTIISATKMTGKTAGKAIVKGPGLGIKAAKMAWNEGFARALARSIQVGADSFYAQGKYFNRQYQFGLGFKNSAGFRAWNVLTQPYSHGGHYQPKFSRLALVRLSEKALYRTLSLAEAPLEIVRTMFPQMFYSISYDAAARVAGTAIDGIGSQARRSFEYLERTNQLGNYDLDRPSSLKNILPAEYFIPNFLLKKGETNAYQARDWWQRSIDQPLNEMVIRYWKRLSVTPKEKRGEVSFMAADVTDPTKVKQTEDARTGALMTVALKDAHHASVENRPIQFRMDTWWRFLFPLLGWNTHSIRATLQSLGTSPRDSRSRTALLVASAATILGFIAYSMLSGEEEKGLKKAIAEGINGEVYPEHMIYEAGDAGEASKILALDSTAWLPQMHSLAQNLLGESNQTPGDKMISLFSVEKLNSLLRYVKGAVNTGDPSYGLASLGKQMVPFLRPWIQKMESQQGLIELKNARTITAKSGPEELIDKSGPVQFHEPTKLTPFKERLANAVFRGDAQATSQAANEFVAKAIEIGQTPDKAQQLLRQAMTSINPTQLGGRKMTDEQHAEMLSKLGGRESEILNTAENHWTAAIQSLGLTTPLMKQEQGGGYAGATSRRTGGARPNRLRVGRSTRSTLRTPRMRTPRLRVSRSRFRASRTNRTRRRSTRM